VKRTSSQESFSLAFAYLSTIAGANGSDNRLSLCVLHHCLHYFEVASRLNWPFGMVEGVWTFVALKRWWTIR
jgi:hypothetical protein